MSIIPFKSVDEVVSRANRTNYGSGRGCLDQGHQEGACNCRQRSGRLRCAGKNCYNVLDTRAPFGGFKQSGIGRELGEYGLQQYTEVKTVTVKL